MQFPGIIFLNPIPIRLLCSFFCLSYFSSLHSLSVFHLKMSSLQLSPFLSFIFYLLLYYDCLRPPILLLLLVPLSSTLFYSSFVHFLSMFLLKRHSLLPTSFLSFYLRSQPCNLTAFVSIFLISLPCIIFLCSSLTSVLFFSIFSSLSSSFQYDFFHPLLLLLTALLSILFFFPAFSLPFPSTNTFITPLFCAIFLSFFTFYSSYSSLLHSHSLFRLQIYSLLLSSFLSFYLRPQPSNMTSSVLFSSFC